MVLVKEDNDDQENAIYFLSKSLMDFETCNSHVEKLDLATVIAVQIFRHYILLHTTSIFVEFNPMYYILTRQVLGGEYSRWIVILKEFYLEFTKSSLRKSLVFIEMVCDLPCTIVESDPIDSFQDESFFLISLSGP